ncbi:MAG: MBL fold metallo-hydrolase [archaeon]
MVRRALALLVLAVLAGALLLAGCAVKGLAPAAPAEELRAVPGGENLTVRFISVGQGDAILLNKGNFSVLVDGGKAGSEEAIFLEMNSTGDRSIELVVATHPDSDHIGGLTGVLRECNFTNVWDSGIAEDTESYRSYISQANRGNLAYPKRGDFFNFSGIEISILNPGKGAGGLEKNENSVVLWIKYGSFSLLLTGDCEGSCETELAVPDVDVLKVAHHGSKYATSAKFVSIARPELSVISVGLRNPYGHPANETIKRLEAVGSNVLRTDLDGTVVLTTDGKNGFAASPN